MSVVAAGVGGFGMMMIMEGSRPMAQDGGLNEFTRLDGITSHFVPNGLYRLILWGIMNQMKSPARLNFLARRLLSAQRSLIGLVAHN